MVGQVVPVDDWVVMVLGMDQYLIHGHSTETFLAVREVVLIQV
jgi:sRNA-binding regulator protein Hfq